MKNGNYFISYLGVVFYFTDIVNQYIGIIPTSLPLRGGCSGGAGSCRAANCGIVSHWSCTTGYYPIARHAKSGGGCSGVGSCRGGTRSRTSGC